MRCTMCQGPFHPATGHWESEKRHWCGACYRNEILTLLKSYLPRRWGRLRFYDHAQTPPPQAPPGWRPEDVKEDK